MPGVLARTRSFRILRGRKQSHQQEHATPTPLSTYPQAELDKLKATTPVPRSDFPVETPDLIQRPSTSSGPADRGKLFHQDAFLDDHISPTPFSSHSKSTSTLLYTTEFRESREGFIGIALGSPAMAPNWSAMESSGFNPDTHQTVTQVTANPPSLLAKEEEVQKPKLSRWKSIFGKKSQPPPEQKTSFYQVAQTVMSTRADSHHDSDSLNSQSTPRFEDVQEMESASPPAFKPEIRGSRKLPKGQAQPSTETRPRALTHGTMMGNRSTLHFRTASSAYPPTSSPYNGSPTASLARDGSPTVSQPAIPIGNRQNSSSKADSSTQLRGDMFTAPRADKPMLDVDIPTIKMERYSIMFGSVLQTSSESTSNHSSSLLVRRQGNTERLKPLNALSVKHDENNSHLGVVKPQRRATSPTLAPKSPGGALSLFPQASNNASPALPSSTNRPHVVQRSQTLPKPSPNRRNFSYLVSPSQDVKKALEPPMPEDMKLLAVGYEGPAKKEPADYSQSSQLLSPSTVASTVSPMSFTSGPDELPAVRSPGSASRWRPELEEPEWEILSKPKLARRPSHRELKEALSSHPSSAALEPPAHASPSSTRSPTPEEQARAMDNNSKPSTPHIMVETLAPRSADRLELSPRPRGHGSPKEPRTTRRQTSGLTIGVARSVSVSRASPRSADMLKPVLVRRGTDGSEMLLDSRALTPTLVELKDRRSQRVQLVEA